MYSAPYGYGNPAGQPYNGAPPGQNPQMQPGPGPSQQQQQMMYNQQYPMGAGGAFPGAPNPSAMMPGGAGAGPAGMMQNTAMPHMAANGQSKFDLLLLFLSLPASHTLLPSPPPPPPRAVIIFSVGFFLLFETPSISFSWVAAGIIAVLPLIHDYVHIYC